MPTYEYRCRDCRHAFESFQRISDAPVQLCPSCGEMRVERLISAGGGIVFKGTGFYATDYRRSDDRGEKPRAGKNGSGEGEASTGTKEAGGAKAKDGAGVEGVTAQRSKGESGS